MSDQHRKEYLGRVHKAQDYIEKNLGSALTLDDIARAACFSPFHFHRVFSAVTGETLARFILRLRLERAAWHLACAPERSVTEIALDTGFSSSAAFARAFRAEFAMSATDYRKLCKTDRKDGKADGEAATYLGQVIQLPTRRSTMSETMNVKPLAPQSIEVRELPAKTLAYLRHVGPYAGDAALFERLWGQFCQWAGPRGVLSRPGAEAICLYHDNTDVTEEAKLRLSLGFTVEPGTPTDPPINLLEIPAGKYVVAHYEIDPKSYGAAWAYVMGSWMPQSGYQPDDRPCYECFLNDPNAHPEGKHIVDLCVGVKPL